MLKEGDSVVYIGPDDHFHYRVVTHEKVHKKSGVVTQIVGSRIAVAFVDGKELWINWNDLDKL